MKKFLKNSQNLQKKSKKILKNFWINFQFHQKLINSSLNIKRLKNKRKILILPFMKIL